MYNSRSFAPTRPGSFAVRLGSKTGPSFRPSRPARSETLRIVIEVATVVRNQVLLILAPQNGYL